MEAKNVATAVRMPHADAPVAVAVPVEDGELIAATSAESAGMGCNMALDITGWISLMVNAANVVTMSVMCFLVVKRVIALGLKEGLAPDVACFIFFVVVLSMIASILMARVVLKVLHGEYCRGVHYDGVDEGFTDRGESQMCCLVVECVVLLLFSLWPIFVGLVILTLFDHDQSSSSFSFMDLVVAIWVAVTVSFAAFAIVLFTRLCTRHMS